MYKDSRSTLKCMCFSSSGLQQFRALGSRACGVNGGCFKMDSGLVYGLGFPKAHGRWFTWLDDCGLRVAAKEFRCCFHVR